MLMLSHSWVFIIVNVNGTNNLAKSCANLHPFFHMGRQHASLLFPFTLASHLHVVEVLLHQSQILGTDLLLELLNLVLHDLELAFHLLDLILGLNQVLAVEGQARNM